MQYLLLIYENEKIQAGYTAEQRQQLFAEYGAFTEDIKASKAMVAGDALEPVSTATTVRIREGKTMTVDGPFAETKEQLGGYYLIEAENLDAAVKIAARIPAAKTGSVEVRPVMVWE